MKEIVTYLTFQGTCGAAMKFYARCLGGELFMMPFTDMPGGPPPGVPPAGKDMVMHASLTIGTCKIMASDAMPGAPFHQGNNFSVALSPESVEETEKLFAALGENGTVTMALQDTFWGAYFGMITDQFGVNWMFNFDRPQQ